MTQAVAPTGNVFGLPIQHTVLRHIATLVTGAVIAIIYAIFRRSAYPTSDLNPLLYGVPSNEVGLIVESVAAGAVSALFVFVIYGAIFNRVNRRQGESSTIV